MFVPHELLRGKNTRVYDLPLFIETDEVVDYLKKSPQLARRKLQWIESWESPDIAEYVSQQGKPS